MGVRLWRILVGLRYLNADSRRLMSNLSIKTSFCWKPCLSPTCQPTHTLRFFPLDKGYFKAGEADPARQLSEDPAYCLFAYQALNQAIAHLEAIHNQPGIYRADGAFSVDEAHVIARAVRVAAWRDESWFAEAFPRLLALVCSAPGEAKNGALAVAGNCTGSCDRGEPYAGERAGSSALGEKVRHAGVQKKLKRNLKPAQLALAKRG